LSIASPSGSIRREPSSTVPERMIRIASSPGASGASQARGQVFQRSSTDAADTIDAAIASDGRRSASVAPVLSYTRTMTSVKSVSAANAGTGIDNNPTMSDNAQRPVIAGSIESRVVNQEC
jgi:hypothetical protein